MTIIDTISIEVTIDIDEALQTLKLLQETMTDVALQHAALVRRISPEMMAAGAEALSGRYFDLVDSREYPEIARIVFEAMEAKVSVPASGAQPSVGNRTGLGGADPSPNTATNSAPQSQCP